MKRWISVILTAALALLLTALALWTLPILLTRHPLSGVNNAAVLTAQNAARTACVASLVFLGAAATVYFTAHTFFLTRRGQVTDRYTKAVQQLGDKELNVRLGGIYALEGLMRDSNRDQATIIEVLAAFVRDKAPREEDRLAPANAPAEVAPMANALNALRVWLHGGTTDGPSTPAPRSTDDATSSVVPVTHPDGATADVHAALSVLGRRIPGKGERPLDLRDCNLRGVDLGGAKLKGARLSGSLLSSAILDGADLRQAWLNGADLDNASLDDTDLTEAWFNAPGIFDATSGSTKFPLDDRQRASAKGVTKIRWVPEPAPPAQSP